MVTTELKALSEIERQLFDVIQRGDEGLALSLLPKVRIDCLDENGMTPLSQSCFKGSLLLARALIDRGADVNDCNHKQGFTALMFAALSGNAELCRLLLDYGAVPDRTNNINRSATQMAAFTGQHRCVSVINNYLSLDVVERIVNPRGIDAKPRLPLYLAPAIHELTRTYNVHPCQTVKFLIRNAELLDHKKYFVIVMEELFEKQMKQKETNEIMALKLFVLTHTIKEAFSHIKQQRANVAEGHSDKPDTYYLRMFLKTLLATDLDKNYCRTQEMLLRQAIKKFPYHHCVCFQTVVKTLSGIEIVKLKQRDWPEIIRRAKCSVGIVHYLRTTPVQGSDNATALNIVHQVLLGHRMLQEQHFCSTCGEPNANKRCSSCRTTPYCSGECQRDHWFVHKRWCATMAAEKRRWDDSTPISESQNGADGQSTDALIQSMVGDEIDHGDNENGQGMVAQLSDVEIQTTDGTESQKLPVGL